MKTLRYFFVAALAMVMGNVTAQEVTLDFSTVEDNWNLPTTKVIDETSYTYGGYTIKLCGTTGNGFAWNSIKEGETVVGHYLILGKQGAYLTLPAFSFDVEKIVIEGNSGASASVKQNIFVGETAVSTETTGAKGTNTYLIASGSQAAGTVYTLKVTSAHNTQITKILIYKASGVAVPEISGNEIFQGSTQVTITAEEGAQIYYTTDGVEPSSNSLPYTAPFTIENSCEVKAVASKGGALSSVVSKSFTKTVGDGTKANPFTCADMLALPASYEATGKWVKGIIVGSIKNNAVEETPTQTSNVALAAVAGTTEFTLVVPVQLSDANKVDINVVDNPGNIGKELAILGDITKYFGNMGVKNTSEYALGGSTGLETVWDFTVLPTAKIDGAGNIETNAADGIFVEDEGAAWQQAYNKADLPDGTEFISNADGTVFEPTKHLVWSALSSNKTVFYRNYPDKEGARYGGKHLFFNKEAEVMIPCKAGQVIEMMMTGSKVTTKKITSQDVVETFDDEGTPVGGVKLDITTAYGDYFPVTLTAKVENVYLTFQSTLCIQKITVKDGGGAGIAAVKAANKFAGTQMYNLAGQKVGKDYKGIVIMNGKKVVLK